MRILKLNFTRYQLRKIIGVLNAWEECSCKRFSTKNKKFSRSSNLHKSLKLDVVEHPRAA